VGGGRGGAEKEKWCVLLSSSPQQYYNIVTLNEVIHFFSAIINMLFFPLYTSCYTTKKIVATSLKSKSTAYYSLAIDLLVSTMTCSKLHLTTL